MTEDEQKTIDHINQMSQHSMAALWRTAPAGHPYFDTTKPYHVVFDKRFKELGGFTPAISKAMRGECQAEECGQAKGAGNPFRESRPGVGLSFTTT